MSKLKVIFALSLSQAEELLSFLEVSNPCPRRVIMINRIKRSIEKRTQRAIRKGWVKEEGGGHEKKI